MFLKGKLQDDLFPVPVPFIVSAFVDLLYKKKYMSYISTNIWIIQNLFMDILT